VDDHTWDSVVESITEIHTLTMSYYGQVIRPHLFVFTAGQLRGYVGLRPIHKGKDAIHGIAEMGHLAAAARADEVVAAWESADIAVACELLTLHPQSGLNIVWATRLEHVHYRMPYHEQILPGPTDRGFLPLAPRWLDADRPVRDGTLEPAIATLQHSSFQPFDSDAPNLLQHAATYLENRGYQVKLTA
jgi:hypothetical protein